MRVEIWFDVVCPWCYLGKTRFERALESFEHRDQVTVTYRSFELDPFADPTQTLRTVDVLAAKYGMSPEQAKASQRQMEERAAADGLRFAMDGLRSGNTRNAHRLIHLAADRGLQAELADRLFRAYFTEQASVFDRDSLTELATGVGLDRDEVLAVLAGDRYADAVQTDQEMARVLGATGVPLFVLDRRYGVSGAQPAEVMTEALRRAWSDSSPTSAAPPG